MKHFLVERPDAFKMNLKRFMLSAALLALALKFSRTRKESSGDAFKKIAVKALLDRYEYMIVIQTVSEITVNRNDMTLHDFSDGNNIITTK